MGRWRPKYVIWSTKCPNSRLLSATRLQSHFANWVHFCSIRPNYKHHCSNSCPTSQWLPPWLDALKTKKNYLSFFYFCCLLFFLFSFCTMLPILCKIVNKHYILLFILELERKSQNLNHLYWEPIIFTCIFSNFKTLWILNCFFFFPLFFFPYLFCVLCALNIENCKWSLCLLKETLYLLRGIFYTCWWQTDSYMLLVKIRIWTRS